MPEAMDMILAILGHVMQEVKALALQTEHQHYKQRDLNSLSAMDGCDHPLQN